MTLNSCTESCVDFNIINVETLEKDPFKTFSLQLTTDGNTQNFRLFPDTAEVHIIDTDGEFSMEQEPV